MKILLAEDDRDFGNILLQYITLNGFEVILATDGLKALELYKESSPRFMHSRCYDA